MPMELDCIICEFDRAAPTIAASLRHTGDCADLAVFLTFSKSYRLHE